MDFNENFKERLNMEQIMDFLDIDGLIRLIEQMQGLVLALIRMFGTTFSWLGAGVLTIISVGAGIAIILRIFGR